MLAKKRGWTVEESVKTSAWLFELLLEQYTGKKWQENVLGQCAEVMILSSKPVGADYPFYNEALHYYVKLLKKEFNDKLNKQKRRHERVDKNFISLNDWERAKEHFNHRCAYCRKETKLTYDHFIPLSKGGFLSVENTIPCCKSCNSSKNNRDFHEWYPKQSSYSLENENRVYEYLELI
ncbi:HNH endonuclease [Aerococcus urinaeequi]|uniref:HNH endonuclease n=1 Tax=Aerococcus urinaeequi TaxID=51665 RepID=UPI003D6C0D96